MRDLERLVYRCSSTSPSYGTTKPLPALSRKQVTSGSIGSSRENRGRRRVSVPMIAYGPIAKWRAAALRVCSGVVSGPELLRSSVSHFDPGCLKTRELAKRGEPASRIASRGTRAQYALRNLRSGSKGILLPVLITIAFSHGQDPKRHQQVITTNNADVSLLRSSIEWSREGASSAINMIMRVGFRRTLVLQERSRRRRLCA